MADAKYSPFGYYFGKFLDAFNILDDHHKSEFDDDLDAWEVSVIVRARTPEEAYDKIVEIAQRDTRQYKDELHGVSIEWTFAGITELDPILHDPCMDTDFMYVEHHEIKLSDHLQYVRQKDQLCKA